MERIRNILASKSLTVLEIILLGVLLLFGYTRDFASVEFHPDESYWIVSSVRLDKLLDGDFDSAIWTEDPVSAFEVRPVPGYFARIGQRLGNIPAENLPIYWDWAFSVDENTARGAMPSNDVIWWSRLPMAVISAFSMLLTAILLARSHSRFAAFIFAIISLNGHFLLNLRRAMSEASILFFTVLTMIAAYKLFSAARNNDTRKSILWALAVGAFSGLAGQSKLTGLVCAGIAILGMILITIPRPKQWLTILKQRNLLVIIFIITITTLTVFIASYPFFYTSTIDRISETFYARTQIMDYQAYAFADTLMPEGARLPTLFNRIFDYPLHTNGSNVLSTVLHWANFIFVSLGVVHIIRQVRIPNNEQDIHLTILLGALLCAVPMLFTPFDWERYYLYPIYFACIFFAVGIGQITLNFILAEKVNE